MACLTCFLKASFLANVPWQPAIWIHFYALFRVETWSPFHPVSLVVKTHHWNNKIATGLDVLALNKALMISWKCSRSERCIRRREALSQLRTKDAKAFWRWMMSFGIDKGVEVWMSGSCNVWPLLFWKNLRAKIALPFGALKVEFPETELLGRERLLKELRRLVQNTYVRDLNAPEILRDLKGPLWLHLFL